MTGRQGIPGDGGTSSPEVPDGPVPRSATPMTSAKSSVYYVGNFHFPDLEAGAHRVLGIGRCLREAGFGVTFLGSEIAGREKDFEPGRGYVYDGFPYLPAGNAGAQPGRRAIRFVRNYLTGASALDRLERVCVPGAAAVIVYQGSAPLLARVRSFCDRRGLAMIVDAAEWYDRGHVPGGPWGPMALDSELRMRVFHRRADGVIAISRFLETYYRHRRAAVLRVPPLVDLQADIWRAPSAGSRPRKPFRIAFVGNAGKKDLLTHAVRGLALAGDAAKDCELVMVGPTAAEVSARLGPDAGLLDDLRGSLRFEGRLSHRESLGRLALSDFSVLLRPDARYARAGFPTKLVESLAMGIPPILNITGDIGVYVRDGIEGLIVPDESPAAFARGLRRALALTPTERTALRANARTRAEECFDFRPWVGPVGDFMRTIVAGALQAR